MICFLGPLGVFAIRFPRFLRSSLSGALLRFWLVSLCVCPFFLLFFMCRFVCLSDCCVCVSLGFVSVSNLRPSVCDAASNMFTL